MARRELDYTVDQKGRDFGKTFHIREMSAADAEDWAYRALSAAARGGVNISPDILAMGMQGIAAAGIEGLMRMSIVEARPLLEEMMACVKIKPDPKHPNVIRDLIDDDIEEVATRVLLRAEVLKLHTSFLSAADESNSTLASAAAPNSPPIPTSPARSGPRSQPAKPPSRSSVHITG